MRAAEHAPRGPFRLLERIHGLAEITVCGCGVLVERPRVVPPYYDCQRRARTSDAAVQIAWRRAKERFLLVGLSDRPTATAAELERLLPSHFLRLSRHHRGRDGPRRRAPAKIDRAREAAFVAANVADAAFYELAREAFMGRRLACHGNSS